VGEISPTISSPQGGNENTLDPIPFAEGEKGEDRGSHRRTATRARSKTRLEVERSPDEGFQFLGEDRGKKRNVGHCRVGKPVTKKKK